MSYPEKSRGLNVFSEDRNLQRYLQRRYPGLLHRQQATLASLGRFCGDKLDAQAEYSDRHARPVLQKTQSATLPAPQRGGELILNDRYKDCQQEIYRHGVIAKCFDAQQPEAHMLAFLTQYMVSYSDISTGCPFAMTHPVALVLDKLAPPAVKQKFLPEILRTDGKTPVGGTWATEKHGGSDVGRSVTKAIAQADGSFILQGHQWFASAVGFDRWLTIKTARPGDVEGGKGLGLYLVPSHLDADWSQDVAVPNNVEITDLKRKMGTRALPTGEVALNGTVAYEIAPEGEGLKAMMMALGCSRVHNAMGAAGVMRRAYVEAMCWASHREAFGKKIIEQPMVQKRLLDLKTDWMAGSALACEAALSFDDALADETKQDWSRVATALAKYKTAKQATDCMQAALRLGAGNHYTEDFPTERLLRDAEVLAVWEGPAEIQALELMRMMKTGGPAFLARIDGIAAQLAASAMPEEIARLKTLRAGIAAGMAKLTAQEAPQVADEFLDVMAEALTYALLCEEADYELRVYNDRSKWLASDYYYRRNIGGETKISFVPHELRRHFNAAAQDLPIRPERDLFAPPPRQPGDPG